MIPFYKYQATGNDFIIIDNRSNQFQFSQTQIENLCNRRFGIGADGFILLENEAGYDFKMIYYNSDGRESSMCGNGGRCITRFALDIGIPINQEYHFIAIDGSHYASEVEGLIALKMIDVNHWSFEKDSIEIYTGSPHLVKMVSSIPNYKELIENAKSIRYNDKYREQGINVNFYTKNGNEITSCTYERGVEDETYSCGTGAVAIALSDFLFNSENSSKSHRILHTKGGVLKVDFEYSTEKGFQNIYLTGPATMVFEGKFDLKRF